MNNEPLPMRLDKPVDEVLRRILRLFGLAAGLAHCEYFMAGTAVVGLLLRWGRSAHPVTTYIDFGIAVENWGRFEILKTFLIGTGEFVAAENAPQRLLYTAGIPGLSVPIDLIPFGGISSAGKTIAWPPSGDVVRDVAGFEEAFASSVLIEIEDDLEVRVASIPGLTLLKLIVWADRGLENCEDAPDLYHLLTTYKATYERLWDQEFEVLNAVDLDEDLANVELLGRHVAAICEAPLSNRLRSLLASDRNREVLASQMVEAHRPFNPRLTEAELSVALVELEGIVNALRRGIMYTRPA